MNAAGHIATDISRARRIGGISGLIAGLLFAVGNALWAFEMPDGGTSGTELVAFYDENADRIIVGASLSLLGIAAFLVSASAIRRVLIDAEGGDVLATTSLAGAILGASAGLVAEAVNMMGAIRAKDGELSEELARSLFEIPQMMGSVGAGLGLGVFALATAWIAWRSGRVVPNYDVVQIALIGLILLSPLAFLPAVPGACLVYVALLFGFQLLRRPPSPAG